MIVFELICAARHRFEGWFASANDFENQKERGLLVCPNCGDSGIEKLLTAKIRTMDSGSADAPASAAGAGLPARTEKAVALHELIDHVLKNSEDVGERFAEEARRMYREESPQRSIRGTASRQETEELLDEGIPILPLPIPPQGGWH